MKKAFIITLTGPSACGKGIVTSEIIKYSSELQTKGKEFYPFMFKKDVTRNYRVTEALKIVSGLKGEIDVNSVDCIPEKDDLVYRTYGDEYALSTKALRKELNSGKTPIVVVNDIRVVEELKKIFKGKVLSLFIFRHIIPDIEQHKKAGSERGGVSGTKILSRYEKAVALYRVYIENIQIFDRVILNVREGDINLVSVQSRGIIDGVFDGSINLNKTIRKGPKLFIVSGNAESGKDDIIKAAKSYGKQQTDILIKSTSRQEEDDDVGEIVCKYIPKKSIVDSFAQKYTEAINSHKTKFSYEFYEETHRNELQSKFNEFNSKENNILYEDFVKASLLVAELEERRKILKPLERFWIALKEEQQNRMINGLLPYDDYLWILNNYFEHNNSSNYIMLDKIQESTADQKKEGIKLIKDSIENKSWIVEYDEKKYIFYENNELYGKPIKYGFRIDDYVKEWSNNTRKKHLVLTASLPNIFKLCKENFGEENVLTIFTYSQISWEEHEKHSDAAVGKAKLKEYDDISRYARHIAEFDYALIYAETSLSNLSGNQKDELVDQMFRLFRAYNE